MNSRRKKNTDNVYEFKRELVPGASRATGEIASISGVYEVQHLPHAKGTQFFIAKGMRLPACPECGKAMSFRLLEPVNHISEDPDFR